MTLKGEWSSETTYSVGDVARYASREFYQCIRPCKAGTPCADALYWLPLPSPLAECVKMIMDMIAVVKDEIETDVGSDFAMVAPEYTKTTYSKGAVVRHSGKLYKAKAAIETAENWTAAHWDETTVGAEVAALNAAAETIPTNINDEGVTLTSGGHDYLVTVDASGEDPEVIATLIEEET